MPAKAQMRVVGDSPSEVIVKEAASIKHVKDARGRVIGVVKPSALQRYRTMKMLGGENANNGPVMGHAMLVCCVKDIDGQPVVVNSERQIEAMIERLDDDGLAAVAECLVADFGINAPGGDQEAMAKN